LGRSIVYGGPVALGTYWVYTIVLDECPQVLKKLPAEFQHRFLAKYSKRYREYLLLDADDTTQLKIKYEAMSRAEQDSFLHSINALKMEDLSDHSGKVNSSSALEPVKQITYYHDDPPEPKAQF